MYINNLLCRTRHFLVSTVILCTCLGEFSVVLHKLHLFIYFNSNNILLSQKNDLINLTNFSKSRDKQICY